MDFPEDLGDPAGFSGKSRLSGGLKTLQMAKVSPLFQIQRKTQLRGKHRPGIA
jgi:hypothetical protein